MMKVVCAACKRDMGEKMGPDVTTHSICPACMDKLYYMPCPTCDGAGRHADSGTMRECDRCEGTGKILRHNAAPSELANKDDEDLGGLFPGHERDCDCMDCKQERVNIECGRRYDEERDRQDEEARG
jgi:RecJ-like exonuclease